MSGSMRASYQPLKASSRRLESPFWWGFLGVLLLALELLLPMCSGDCPEPKPYKTMVPMNYLGGPVGPMIILFYECIPGYGPIDPSKSIKTVCQYDGSFRPALKESCTILSCSKLQEPQNGKVVYVNATTKFGSQVQYVCTEGYYIVGIKNRTCEANETEVIWSGDPPTCEKIFCEPPIRIPNGDYTNRGKDIFEYKDTVTYSCKPSNATDHYTLVGESTLVCIGPDEWSSEPPDCKATYTPIDGPKTSAADLDGGLIAVIVLTVLGVAVVGTCV